MKRKNYFALLLLAIITFSFSSCIVIDNPEDEIVYNTPSSLSDKLWVETHYNYKENYFCIHRIRFNSITYKGTETFDYRDLDDNGRPLGSFKTESFTFDWRVITANSRYMEIALDFGERILVFKDMQVRLNTLTGWFDGSSVVFEREN